MFTYRNFIFPCRGNEFAFYLPEYFSLLSRGAVLHSLGISAVGITENVMITRYRKQHSGVESQRPPHTCWLGELLAGKVHHPYFLDIFGNSTTENISIIICSGTED